MLFYENRNKKEKLEDLSFKNSSLKFLKKFEFKKFYENLKKTIKSLRENLSSKEKKSILGILKSIIIFLFNFVKILVTFFFKNFFYFFIFFVDYFISIFYTFCIKFYNFIINLKKARTNANKKSSNINDFDKPVNPLAFINSYQAFLKDFPTEVSTRFSNIYRLFIVKNRDDLRRQIERYNADTNFTRDDDSFEEQERRWFPMLSIFRYFFSDKQSGIKLVQRFKIFEIKDNPSKIEDFNSFVRTYVGVQGSSLTKELLEEVSEYLKSNKTFCSLFTVKLDVLCKLIVFMKLNMIYTFREMTIKELGHGDYYLNDEIMRKPVEFDHISRRVWDENKALGLKLKNFTLNNDFTEGDKILQLIEMKV